MIIIYRNINNMLLEEKRIRKLFMKVVFKMKIIIFFVIFFNVTCKFITPKETINSIVIDYVSITEHPKDWKGKVLDLSKLGYGITVKTIEKNIITIRMLDFDSVVMLLSKIDNSSNYIVNDVLYMPKMGGSKNQYGIWFIHNINFFTSIVPTKEEMSDLQFNDNGAMCFSVDIPVYVKDYEENSRLVKYIWNPNSQIIALHSRKYKIVNGVKIHSKTYLAYQINESKNEFLPLDSKKVFCSSQLPPWGAERDYAEDVHTLMKKIYKERNNQ